MIRFWWRSTHRIEFRLGETTVRAAVGGFRIPKNHIMFMLSLSETCCIRLTVNAWLYVKYVYTNQCFSKCGAGPPMKLLGVNSIHLKLNLSRILLGQQG